MVRAIMMSKQQIDEFVKQARQDEPLWVSIKDFELNPPIEDRYAKIGSILSRVKSLVEQKLGSNHNFDTGSLVVQLRQCAREELGLPV